MPIYSSTYYLDNVTLASSTCVFLDSGLNIVAPDGYYSDGTITRQLISGILQPYNPCPICGDECKSGNQKGYNNGTAAEDGFYEIVFQTVDVGAIIIKVNSTAANSPMGIMAKLDNGPWSNRLSCNYDNSNPVENMIKPSVFVGSPHPVFFGRRADACACNAPFGPSPPVGCNNSVSQAFVTPKFNWDPALSQFMLQPSLSTWSLDTYMTDSYSGSLYTTVDPREPTNPVDPAGAWMVLPRTATDSNTVRIYVYGICPTTYFELEVTCPLQLPYVVTSSVSSTSAVACTKALNRQMYYVSVSTGIITPPYPGSLGLNDWVFSDPNGASPCLDGFYAINSGSDYAQVQDGRVVYIDACGP